MATLKETLQATNLDLSVTIPEIIAKLPNIADCNSGQYVWKKCTYTKINLTQITNSVNPTILQVTSDDVDLSTLNESSFVGLTGTYLLNGSTYNIDVRSETKIMLDKTLVNFTYNPSTAQLSLSISLGSANRVWNGMEGYVCISKVVSSDSEAYPNGAMHTDGYWYELLGEGIIGVSYETLGFTRHEVYEVTPTSNKSSISIPHSFGSVPKLTYVYAVNPDSHSEQFGVGATLLSKEDGVGYEINGNNGSIVSGGTARVTSASNYTLISTVYNYGIRSGVTYRAVLFA